MALGNVLTPQLVQAVRDAIDIVDGRLRAHALARRAQAQGPLPAAQGEDPVVPRRRRAGFSSTASAAAPAATPSSSTCCHGRRLPRRHRGARARFGVPLPAPAAAHRGRGGRGGERADPEGVLEAAAEWFADQLASSPMPRPTSSGGASRRARRALRPRLRARGVAQPSARSPAASPRRPDRGRRPGRRPERRGEPYDRFRHRLMFPIRNAAGRLVGFGGRTLGDDVAKYVNTSRDRALPQGVAPLRPRPGQAGDPRGRPGAARRGLLRRARRRWRRLEGRWPAWARRSPRAGAPPGPLRRGGGRRLRRRRGGRETPSAGRCRCCSPKGSRVRRARFPGDDPDSLRAGSRGRGRGRGR
jgi:hypothetical protein